MAGAKASPRPNYTAAAMLRARELAASDWAPMAITGILEREGHGSPSESTIRRWVSGRQQQPRLSQPQNARHRLHGRTDSDRLAFMRTLRAQGVSCRAIGVVCGVVFGEALSEWQVRQVFRGHDPKTRNFSRYAAQQAAARAVEQAEASAA